MVLTHCTFQYKSDQHGRGPCTSVVQPRWACSQDDSNSMERASYPFALTMEQKQASSKSLGTNTMLLEWVDTVVEREQYGTWTWHMCLEDGTVLFPRTGSAPNECEVPPIPVGQCVRDAVARSNGKLQLNDSDGWSGEHFSMASGMYIPGPKHLFDNLIGDILAKLQFYDDFQASLKIACDARLEGVPRECRFSCQSVLSCPDLLSILDGTE